MTLYVQQYSFGETDLEICKLLQFGRMVLLCNGMVITGINSIAIVGNLNQVSSIFLQPDL